MDFAKAFTYPFQDPSWAQKLIIPALISLIPIFGQIFLIGWMLDITRRIIRQDPTPLPELNVGQQFMDGLKGFLIGLVYAIPIFILEIPIIAVSATAQNGNINPDTTGPLIGIVSLCCGGLIFLYALLMAFVSPAALANAVAKERLGAAFDFKEVFGLVRAAPGAYLLVLVGILISTSLIAPLGVIACGIGLFLTYTYAMAVNGHLYGQAYNEATHNTGFAKVY